MGFPRIKCGVNPSYENDKRYSCRSTSLRLVSAMALAGLRLLGQALAQFMMVWQR